VAYSQQIREAVRNAYVRDRLPLEAAADRVGVSYSTAQAWKRKDAADGWCWDKARAASRMATGGLGDITTQLLEDFAILFQVTVEQIRDAEVDPLKKAEAISRLSDAYTKTMRAATKGAPEIGRLAMALEVLDLFSRFVRAEHPEHAEALIEVLEPFGQTLASTYG
jgi:hypothetical protein